MWGQRLCSIVERADGLAHCISKDCRMGSIAGSGFLARFPGPAELEAILSS